MTCSILSGKTTNNTDNAELDLLSLYKNKARVDHYSINIRRKGLVAE